MNKQLSILAAAALACAGAAQAQNALSGVTVYGALDGGVLNRPEFSRYDVAGKTWAIEGVGVEPDIVVDNDPAREYAGEDQQLDRSIEVILDLLKKNPVKLAPPPPLPVKK